jgi:hypothetical protein
VQSGWFQPFGRTDRDGASRRGEFEIERSVLNEQSDKKRMVYYSNGAVKPEKSAFRNRNYLVPVLETLKGVFSLDELINVWPTPF